MYTMQDYEKAQNAIQVIADLCKETNCEDCPFGIISLQGNQSCMFDEFPVIKIKEKLAVPKLFTLSDIAFLKALEKQGFDVYSIKQFLLTSTTAGGFKYDIAQKRLDIYKPLNCQDCSAGFFSQLPYKDMAITKEQLKEYLK